MTLYHGDCLTVTEWLDADVLVTDPPYGIGYRERYRPGREKRLIAGDASLDVRDSVLALWGDRPALAFGRWDKPRPEGTRHRLVWDKDLGPGMGDISLPWGNGEEEIYVIGSGFVGRRESNVIRARGYAAGSGSRPDHPTPKPVALMEALIEKCPPGVVADPFAGSGGTLLAARNLGRRVIGVELEERYCELIAKRLAQRTFDFRAPVVPARKGKPGCRSGQVSFDF